MFGRTSPAKEAKLKTRLERVREKRDGDMRGRQWQHETVAADGPRDTMEGYRYETSAAAHASIELARSCADAADSQQRLTTRRLVNELLSRQQRELDAANAFDDARR